MTYDAGQLRDRVQVLSRATTTGTRGQATASFTVLDTRFANFKELGGKEMEQARKVYADATAQVSIRKPSYALTTQHRLRFRSVDYGIGAVIRSGDNYEELLLLLFVVT